MKKAFSLLLCAFLLAGTILFGACGGTGKNNRPETTSAPAATDPPASEEAVTPAPETTEAPTETPETTEAPTAAPETAEVPTEAPTEAPTVPETEAASAVPVTKEEIVAFYANAVNNIKVNGAAGYTKKEFNTMGELKATGNSTADTAIGKAVGGFIKGENDVQAQTYAKGSDGAKSNMLGWELSDLGYVVSAALVPDGENWAVTLLLADEDTPHRGESHLAKAGSVLLWEDLDADLQKVSFLQSYNDVHVKYANYTISAVISPEGLLRSVEHHTDYSLVFGSVKLPIVGTLNDMRIGLENTVLFSDFTY